VTLFVGRKNINPLGGLLQFWSRSRFWSRLGPDRSDYSLTFLNSDYATEAGFSDKSAIIFIMTRVYPRNLPLRYAYVLRKFFVISFINDPQMQLLKQKAKWKKAEQSYSFLVVLRLLSLHVRIKNTEINNTKP